MTYESHTANGGVAEQAQDQLHEGVAQARNRVSTEIDDRSTRFADQVHASVGALRRAAEELEQQGQGAPARAVHRAAEEGDRVATYLRDADGDRVLADAEAFGRRRPAVVISAGLFAGFALSRLLKASSTDRHRRAQTRPGPATPPPARDRPVGGREVQPLDLGGMPVGAPIPDPGYAGVGAPGAAAPEAGT